MKKTNQEIEKIEKLFHISISLLDQGLIEVALSFSRKIVEGILFVIQNNEKIFVEKKHVSLLMLLRNVRSRLVEKYDIIDSNIFFENLEVFIRLGNQAAHYRIDGSEIDVSIEDIKQKLTWTLDWFKVFIPKYNILNESPDILSNPKNNPLPTCLKYLEVENYQSIEKIIMKDIPVDTQFIVMTGDNGEGKTAILQTIAIGMFGNYDEQSNFVLCNKRDVSILIEAKFENNSIVNEFKGFENQFSYIEKNLNFIAYGASRLQLQSGESQDVKALRQSNVYGIFKTDNILLNIEYWFKIQELNKETERIEAVKSLLVELMPSITDIKIGSRKNTNDYTVTYIENGTELLSEQLSSGNKSILAMIGDMIIRLFDAQPKTINPKELSGIVLIDELETHLHPKWQREFPKLLSENFPLIQFIISTHSAIVFLGMPKNSIFFNISRDENKKTTVRKLEIDIENVLPHQILTSPLFDMENIRNVNNKGIEFLSVETDQEIDERLRKEKLLNDLMRGRKFNLPIE